MNAGRSHPLHGIRVPRDEIGQADCVVPHFIPDVDKQIGSVFPDDPAPLRAASNK